MQSLLLMKVDISCILEVMIASVRYKYVQFFITLIVKKLFFEERFIIYVVKCRPICFKPYVVEMFLLDWSGPGLGSDLHSEVHLGMHATWGRSPRQWQ